MTNALPDAGAAGPWCLSCDQSLAGVTLDVCPECGRAFDRADPCATRPTPPWPLGRVLRRSARHAAFALALGSAGALGLMVALFVVGVLDWWPTAMLSIVATPLLGLTILLNVLPGTRPGPRVRVCGIICPALILLTALTAWPLFLSLLAHRQGWEQAADRAAASGPSKRRAWVGIMTYRQTRVYETPASAPAIGFQLTGDDSGGIYLVRLKPGAPCRWYNPSMELMLGDGWWLVRED